MSRIAVLCAAGLLAVTPALAKPAREAPERSADKYDKVVCKRFIQTGSLVKGYRECKTKWAWERERDDLRKLNVSDSCRTRGQGIGCD